MQDLVKQADPAQVSELLDTALEGLDTTDSRLMRLMLEDRLTPWQAADRVQRETDQPLSTLYHRARTLSVEISNHLGQPLTNWVDELRDSGEIRGIPRHLVAPLRKIAKENDLNIEVEETVIIRLVS